MQHLRQDNTVTGGAPTKRRRLNPENLVPVDVGLDFSMMPETQDILDIQPQIAEWEERNNYGVYLYEWHQIRRECGDLRAAQARIYRNPGQTVPEGGVPAAIQEALLPGDEHRQTPELQG